MTEQQKTQISNLRAQGFGYKKIAALLGISIYTVKSHCQTHQLEKGEESAPTHSSFCLNCGAAIKQKEGKKPRKFCSETCRREWWKKHEESRHKKETAIYSFTCGYCGKHFTAYGNNHRKYCSHDCYIKARFGEKNA